MEKYQVWVGGSSLYDVRAESGKEAKAKIREWLGLKRLPRGTGVCRVFENYYDAMVKNNQAIGIDASNM